jgi:ketosteroid isomerase-like protein
MGLGCAARPSTDNTMAVRHVLDSSLAVHARHFQQGDVSGLVDGHTDSVVVRPANIEPVRGSDALRSTLTAWLQAAPMTAVDYPTVDLVVHGSRPFHIVSYRATVQPPGAGQISDHGTCVLFWVREQSDRWRIQRSTCNCSVPISQPPAPAARRE